VRGLGRRRRRRDRGSGGTSGRRTRRASLVPRLRLRRPRDHLLGREHLRQLAWQGWDLGRRRAQHGVHLVGGQVQAVLDELLRRRVAPAHEAEEVAQALDAVAVAHAAVGAASDGLLLLFLVGGFFSERKREKYLGW
jgi:hypothetical protein